MRLSVAPQLSPPDDLGELDPVQVTTPRPCVVIADDDAEMRRLMAESLRRSGYAVEEASDGLDLLGRLEALLEEREDGADAVLVSDLRMPRLDGLALFERLRHAGWRGPLVLITAFGDEATHDQARRTGIDMVLDKPFDLEAFVDAVREVLRR